MSKVADLLGCAFDFVAEHKLLALVAAVLGVGILLLLMSSDAEPEEAPAAEAAAFSAPAADISENAQTVEANVDVSNESEASEENTEASE
tara:strand:- start:2942 stop:3211 length:270 start_codon:yes stop_codon:yes gene_type:complete